MRMCSRTVTVAVATLLVLSLLIAWTGQATAAEPMNWTTTGQVGQPSITSLAWNGADTLFASGGDGSIRSKTGTGAWIDTNLWPAQTRIVWNGVDTLYAVTMQGYVYSKTGAGDWTQHINLSCGTVNSVVWNTATSWIWAVGSNGHVVATPGDNSSMDFGDVGAGPLGGLTYDGALMTVGAKNGNVFDWQGGDWTNIGDTGGDSLTCMAWDETNTRYAGDANGHVYSKVGTGAWADSGALGSAVNCLQWNGTDTLFAGCANGHVYSKTGAGAWTDLGGTGGTSVNAFASNGTDTLYAGGTNAHAYSWLGAGPFTDLGATGAGNPRVSSLISDGADTLYAGCDDGHAYSRTGSSPWTDLGTTGAPDVTGLAWNGSDTLFASSDDWMSRNVYAKTGAGPWVDLGVPGASMTNCIAWLGDRLYAGCSDGFVYTNPGAGPWTDLGDTGPAGIYCFEFNGTDTVYAGSGMTAGYDHIYTKTGAGPWTDIGTPSRSNHIEALVWDGTDTMYALDTYGVVNARTGSGPWRNTGNAGSAFACDPGSLVWDGVDTLYAGGLQSDRAYALRGEGKWEDIGATGCGSNVNALALQGLFLYAGGTNGVYKGIMPPTITSITPSSGTQGTTVSITELLGAGFYGTPTVKLKRAGRPDITATGVKVPSSTNITCSFDLTGAVSGPYSVEVTNPDGQSATLDGGFTVAYSTWYLAEGTNAWGFSTYITIENPNETAVTARLSYMSTQPANGTGVVGTRDVALPPRSQTTISSMQDIGPVDFSTRVECLVGKPIAVDRTMFWTGDGAPSPEGHASIGATSADEDWYLPEGSSRWGFETWTLVQNPNATEATVTLTYMVEGSWQKVMTKKVPANCRASFSMAADIGEQDASVQVSSDVPVIAERSVYRNNRREGSCSTGATTPAKDYFLAEGTTAWGFTTYVLVQNPGESDASVTLTYMTPDGPKEQPAFTMPANSRKTVRVNDVPAVSNTDLSVQVSADQPIIAERAMYWGEGTALGEAMHDSIGLDLPHMSFMLPDGQAGTGRETYTLVANPNPGDVTVRVTYLLAGGGTPVTFTDEIPAGSRRTYSMGDKGIEGRASILVQSLDGARPVMVERSMYWNGMGAGTDTIGGFAD